MGALITYLLHNTPLRRGWDTIKQGQRPHQDYIYIYQDRNASPDKSIIPKTGKAGS